MKYWKYALLGMVLFTSNSSNAATITYQATGYIDIIVGPVGTDVILNDTFQIKWSWDTSVTGVRTTNSEQVDYYEAITYTQFSLAGSDSYVSESIGVVGIFNNNGTFDDNYTFQSYYNENGQSVLFGNHQVSEIFSGFYDNTNNNILDTQLPSYMNSDDFSEMYINFVFQNVNSGSSSYVRGTITSLAPAPVPLPATAWLFCSGLIGLAGFARSKRV